MSEQEFQRFVYEVFHKAPPNLPVGVLRETANGFRADGKVASRHVADCIMEAGRRVETNQTEQGGTGRRAAARGRGTAAGSADLPSGSVDYRPDVVSKLLADSLQHDVEKLRAELFGSTEPPFPEFRDAAAWIEAERTRSSDSDGSGDDRGHEILDEIGELASELSRVWDMPIYPPTIERVTISYINPVHRVHVCAAMGLESRLLPIKRFIIAARSSTGFTEESLVEHILSDIRPSLPGLSIATSIFRGFSIPPTDTITIRNPQVTKEDIARVFNTLRKAREGRRAAPLDFEDWRLIDAIRSSGGVPATEKGEFWERMARELDRKPDAVRMRYSRLCRKGVSRALLAELETTS